MRITFHQPLVLESHSGMGGGAVWMGDLLFTPAADLPASGPNGLPRGIPH